MLYKYPQAEFPYDPAGGGEPQRGPERSREFELLDTGVFNENRYFDVFVEYAKATPEDICIRITCGESRAGSGDASPAADTLVPQHVVLGGAINSWR